MSKTTGLRNEVSNGWHLYRDKSFNNPDKSKMVNCLLLLAAFIYWKILLWLESFTTCQVLNRTGDLRDSQISATSGGLEHITLEAPWPAPATSINYLLLMLKNVQFPSLLIRSSDAVLKFHDLESFAFWRGFFFFAKVETWIHHFLQELCSQRRSELNFRPGFICEKSVDETDTKLRPATHKNVNE